MNVHLSILLFALCLHSVSANVVVLTDANFTEQTSQGKWLVEFYAPWCPHCHHLDPIFSEASNRVPEAKLKFAKLDCTTSTLVANAQGIRGYPTLKYFRGGISSDYKGGRSIEELLAFAKKVVSPPVTIVNAQSLSSFRQDDFVNFLFIGTDPKAKEMFEKVADLHHDYLNFGYCSDKSILKKFTNENIAGDVVLLLNDGDLEIFQGGWNPEELSRWIEERKFHVLAKLTSKNFDDITYSGKKTAIAAVDPEMHQE
eukprot:TRINITY_DN8186_c0_g4_i3.p1 TRINITY_DN8186_c0_g4~~TRINITY_DN8186_c0_g4_i3.p1  ORF type:complete len:256 (-),score=48.20 TRINITY_DN8186_c0_g4_i3:587-1354(-)